MIKDFQKEPTNAKKRVLIIYNQLFHYRLPIFKLLSEKYNLTVCYSIGDESNKSVDFIIRKLSIKRLGRFVIHKENIFSLCQNYDVVIAYGEVSWIKLSLLGFFKRRTFKLLFWTIGVSASYDKKFDTIKKWDKLRTFIYRKADALIFYSDYPVKKYINEFNFPKEKLFVAHNTVKVAETQDPISKDSILFIGTLYLQKGLLSLLENYKRAKIKQPNIPYLNLVGSGPEENNIREWIVENGLKDSVFLHGAIYDVNKKADFFLRSFACISPMQAGLSVLESMGYGVPFVTLKDSITGGERFNIIHEKNGVLLNSICDLENIILDIYNFKEKYIEMGKQAKIFYQVQRTPEKMAENISRAIEFVLK